MFYTIYQVTHFPSGKVYIGKHQTNDLDDNYMGSGKHLKRAQDKHGLEEFEKKILHVFDNEDDMNAKEAELVTEEFCKRDDTYNICPGGKGGWGYINTLERSDEWKQKMSMSLSGENNPRYGIPAWNRGKKMSEEFCRQNSERQLGEKNHQYGKTGSKSPNFGMMWINNGLTTKKIPKDSPIPSGWSKGRK